MEKVDVSSIEIRDYAQSLGWSLVKEALKDGLFVLDSPKQDNTQLVFPKDSADANFQELANNSLKRISEFYRKCISQIVDEIREVNDDVINLRYYSDNKVVNSISFEEAYEAISATRQMILSAASTVVNPRTFHPKLNRTEPQDLIKKTRFRHTQEGSFIIKVSIPFEPTQLTNTLFDLLPDAPIGRQTVEVISQSSKEIIDSIDSNSIFDLSKSQIGMEKPIISYNFCESLIKIFDEERQLPFELIFNWSRASLIGNAAPTVPSKIAFPFSYKNKLEELKGYLAPKKKELADIFYGTVESLNGDTGQDGHRSGEVVFALLIENELVRARANLNVEQYQAAIRAHEKGGAYVMIKGILNRQTRVGVVDNISDFKLAEDK